MYFRHPSNNYVEHISNAPIWTLLFGPFYLASKKLWLHAVFYVILAIPTLGISALVYACIADKIIRKHYLRQGWIEEGAATEGSARSSLSIGAKTALGFGAFLVLAAVGAAANNRGNASVSPVSHAAITPASAVAEAEPAPAPRVKERVFARQPALPEVTFGKPTLKREFGMIEVAVEVRNNSDSAYTLCTVTGTFFKGDTIIGVANGGVGQLGAGTSKTAQLMSSDKITGYDELKLEHLCM